MLYDETDNSFSWDDTPDEPSENEYFDDGEWDWYDDEEDFYDDYPPFSDYSG